MLIPPVTRTHFVTVVFSFRENMPSSPGSVDFFISRRGSVAAYAQEVAQVLIEAGYTVTVQDFDFNYGVNIPSAIHNALKNAKHLVVLLSRDYERSYYTLAELFNFIAAAARSSGERRLIVLRIDDCEPQGLLAGVLYGDLYGVIDPEHRRHIILAAAEGRSAVQRPQATVIHGLPPRNPDFTGRDDILAELHLLLSAQDPDAPTPVAIHGLGGLGKTSLAARYAQRHSREYAGVWWTPAENRAALIGDIAEFARLLDPRIASDFDSEKAVKRAFEKLTNATKPWLLIYDNVAHPDNIHDLLPSRGAKVIITSRWANWTGLAVNLELPALQPAETVQFLLKTTQSLDESGASQLGAALGHLPLALEQAAAYIKLSGVSFKEYVDEVDKFIIKDFVSSNDDRSVAATVIIAVRKATEICSHAEPLLAFLSVFSSERIPIALLSSVETFRGHGANADALVALSALSLLKHDPFPDGAPAVLVHRLVQSTMRVRLAAIDSLNLYIKIGIGAIALSLPETGKVPQSWQTGMQLLPHALFLLNEVWSIEEQVSSLFIDRLISFFLLRGAYSSAAVLGKKMLEYKIQTHGEEHPSVATSTANLASILQDAGDLRQSERLLREASRIVEANYGPHDFRTAEVLNLLALAVFGKGDFQEAEAIFRRSIAIGEGEKGQTELQVNYWRDNLAGVLRATGRFAEAEPIIREVLSVVERQHGDSHAEVATVLLNLSELLRSTKRYEEAEAAARRSIVIREKVFGADHAIMADAHNILGNILRDTNRLSDAEIEFRRAIVVFEKAHNADHPRLSVFLNNLALSLVDAGRFLEAEPVLQRALAIATADVEGHYILVQQLLLHLIVVLQHAGKPEKAAEEVESALSRFDNALGNHHPLTIFAAALYAGILSKSLNTDEANDLAARYGLEVQSTGEKHLTVSARIQRPPTQIHARGAITEYVRQQRDLEWIHAYEEASKTGKVERGVQELAYVALLDQGIENARLARRENDSNKAKKLWTNAAFSYRRALSVDSNGHEAMFNLGNVFLSEARTSNDAGESRKLLLQAEQYYRAGLRIKPELANALANRVTALLELISYAVDEREGVSFFERATQTIETIEELDPPSCAALRTCAERLFDYAARLSGRARSDEITERGQKLLCRVLSIEPDNFEAHVRLGCAMLSRANRTLNSETAADLMNEAETEFQKALDLRPEYPFALYNLALSLDLRARLYTPPNVELLEEAERRYRETLRIEPHNSKALTNLGALLMTRAYSVDARGESTSMLDEASELFSTALQFQPEDFEAFLNVGNVSLMRGQLASNPMEAALYFAQAEKSFSEADRRWPKRFEVIRSIAQTLGEQAVTESDSDAASSVFERAEAKFEEAIGFNIQPCDTNRMWGLFLLERGTQSSGDLRSALLLKAKVKLVEAGGHSRATAYDLGRVSALLGQFDECQDYLDEAARAGNLPLNDSLDSDEALDSVRSQPWFLELRSNLSR